MKRKHIYKKVISIMTIASMLLTEGSVMANDLSIDTDGIVLQENAENTVGEEQEYAENIEEDYETESGNNQEESGEELPVMEPDEEETDDITIVLESEDEIESEEIIGDDWEEEPEIAVQSAENAAGEKNEDLLGGGSVVEASTADWKYIYNKTGAALTEYIGTNTNVTIPKSVGDHKVIAVKKDLLKDKSDVITSVVIEAEITSLPDGFFSGFRNLESAKLADTITDLGRSTFNSCENLKEVKLPSELKKIGPSAFSWCSSLEKIVIPEKVVEIGYDAFWLCGSLKQVQYPKNLKTIEGEAFRSCSSLKEISLPEGVEEIGWKAFDGCTALEKMNLPDSIKITYNQYGSIEKYGLDSNVFSGCSSLKSIKLPKNLTYIREGLFSGCSSLKNLELPSGITEIGSDAFNGCSSLSRIKLPNKVTKIGDQAFKDCLVLTNLSVYEAMESFGDNVFTGDPFLVLSCVNNPNAVSYAKNNKILYTTVEIKSSGTDFSAKITKDTINQLQNGQKLAIDAGDVSVVFDADAVNTIRNASTGSNLTLAVKGVEKGNTGNIAQDAVIDKFVENDGKVLDLALTDNHDKHVEFSKNNAGTFSITMPYAAPSGETPVVVCIYEDGQLEKVKSSYDASAQAITFVTPHFSVFAIGNGKLLSDEIWRHVHKGKEISKKATCTRPGQKAYYVCDCGKMFWDKNCTKEITDRKELKKLVIPALGHKMVLVSAKKKATNTATGKEAQYKCSRCSYVQGGKVIPREANVTLYKGVNKTYILTSGNWKLARTKAATLKNNKLTVKKTGTVKVTDQKTKQTVTIKIVKPVLSVNKNKATLKVGQKYQLVAKATPAKTIKYSSSNKKIATVTGQGVIQAKKKGKTTISVKANGMTKKVTIMVK